MTFDHQPLIAQDLESCITLRVGPGVDDIVDLSRQAVAEQERGLRTALLSLPGTGDGANWETLQTYTTSGMAAKVAIALGHHFGLWKMHPSPATPDLWTSPSYPTILAGTLVEQPYRLNGGTPKPSRGDLEVGTKPCTKCGRPTGPWDSHVHALLAAGPDSSLCIECELGFGPGA
jgi:hypothetical protein